MTKTIHGVLACAALALFSGAQPAQQADRVDLVVRGGAIVTMDPDRRVIEDGLVAIAGDRIAAVGPRADLDGKYRALKVIDAAGKTVLPGLINLHTHSSMILYRGLADDHTLDTWGEALGPLHQNNSDRPGFRKAGNAVAGLEMLKRGTTTFVEMYHYPELVAEVASAAGLRAIVTLRLPFEGETEKFDPVHARSEFAKLYAAWKTNPLITPGLAVHGPHTVPTAVAAFTGKLAEEYDVALVIHLSESQTEVDTIKRKFGKTPTEYLDDLGLLSPRVLAVHCVKLSERDIAILKERGVSVAHNPESNAKLGNGIAPIPALLQAGVTVGLGTDSGVSNNNLDLFEEMDFGIKIQRVLHQDWKVMTARQALEMATIGGARAIRKEREIGSLEIGKKADLIIVDTDKPELQPVYDRYSHLVYVTRGGDVGTSIVNGRVLMENRRVLTMDEAAIARTAAEFRRLVTESIKTMRNTPRN